MISSWRWEQKIPPKHKYLRHNMAVHPRRQWFPKTDIISKNHALRDFRLPFFGISRIVKWGFLPDVSGQPIGPIFNGQRGALTFEDGTVMLSRNIGKKVPFYAAWNPKSAQSHGSKIIVGSYHTCFVIGKSQVHISALRLGILRFFKLRYEAEKWVWLTVQRTDGLQVMILGENGVKSCERGGSKLFQDRFISSVL